MRRIIIILILNFSILNAFSCKSLSGYFLGYTEGYEKINNKVYFCHQNGNATKIDQVDTNSFKQLSNFFGRDKNKIYYKGEEHTFDINSFKIVSNKYVQDKDGIYEYSYNGLKTTSYHINSFEVLSANITKDKNGIYLENRKVDINRKTFKVIDSEYVIDKNGLYKIISKWNKNKTKLYKVLHKKSKIFEKKYYKINTNYTIFRKRQKFINFCLNESSKEQFRTIKIALSTKNEEVKDMNIEDVCKNAATFFASKYKNYKYTNYYNLDLENKALEDISALKYFNGIKKLNLEKNFILNIPSLHLRNNIIEINLNFNPITNITNILSFKNLISLKLLNTQFLDNIQALNQLPNLKILEMSHGKKDLKVLHNLVNLKSLSLSSVNIKSLCDLKDFVSLENLDLRKNYNLKSLECIDNFKKLKKLRIEKSPITDLTPLIHADSIEKFHFHDMPVSDISPLAKMKNLRSILFTKTKIKYLSPLKSSKSIKFAEDTREKFIEEYFNRSLAWCSPKSMKEVRAGKTCLNKDGSLKPWWKRILGL